MDELLADAELQRVQVVDAGRRHAEAGDRRLRAEDSGRRVFAVIGNACSTAVGVRKSGRVEAKLVVDRDRDDATGAEPQDPRGTVVRVVREIRPATTMVVVAALVDPRWRLEIEAEAIVGSA